MDLFTVESDESHMLVGTVLRKTICTLLKHKAFAPCSQSTGADPPTDTRVFPLVAWGTLECIYPRYPDLDSIQLSDADRNCWLDLRPYIDNAPITMNEHASVQVRDELCLSSSVCMKILLIIRGTNFTIQILFLSI